MRFGGKEKLSLKYVGSFDIMEWVGEVAYRVVLPPQYAKLHDIFHISMLKKYIQDETYVIKYDIPGWFILWREVYADCGFQRA